MGFLERAIRRGVKQAIGGTVEGTVTNAVAPKVNQSFNALSPQQNTMPQQQP